MKTKILAPVLILQFLFLYFGGAYENWPLCMVGGILLMAVALSAILSK